MPWALSHAGSSTGSRGTMYQTLLTRTLFVKLSPGVADGFRFDADGNSRLAPEPISLPFPQHA